MCKQRLLRAPAKRGQRRRPLNHRHLCTIAQPMRGGQRQFHARHPATDHRHHGRALARPHVVDEPFPAVGEGIERLGRHRMIGEAWQVRHLRRDADVDGGDIISHFRAARHDHPARLPVNPRRAAKDQSRARETGQLHQVDLQRLTRVMARDMARQHPRIGRRRRRVDDRQPNTRQRLHPPHAQHKRMGMSAPDHHKIARKWDLRLHDGPSFCPPS